MPTPAERRALLFVASIAVLGAGWRTLRATDVAPPSDADRRALEAQIAAVDSARSSARAGRGGRRPRSGPERGGPARHVASSAALIGPEIIDVDRASAEELERLPRIGPALARRIVADRDSLGPFGSLDALQRVRGIGPAMVRELAPRVTFSANPRSPPASGTGDRTPIRGQIVWRSPAPP